MARYLGVVLFTIAAIVAFGLGAGGIILYVLDPVAAIIMLVFPLLYQLILYGKFFPKAFSAITKKEKPKEVLENAYNFFKGYGKVLWTTAILLISLDIVILLVFLENREALWPAIFFMVNLIIMAALFNLLIVAPYKTLIKRRLAQLG